MAIKQPVSNIDLAKQKLMTAEAYAELTHETPYIFILEKDGKQLTYFGSPHTDDPESPVFSDIESRYRSADPDMVFVEGFADLQGHEEESKKWALSLSREDAIRMGESGFALWLAERDGKETKSPEPHFEDEIGHLESSGFTREEIFVFCVARYLLQYQRSIDKQTPMAEYVQSELDFLARAAHWQGFPFTLDHFIALYEKFIGKLFDPTDESLKSVSDPIPWRDAPAQTRINEISRASSKFRDMHIIEEVGKTLQSHNNLFVVYGASHAVMQEPAMRMLLGLNESDPQA